MARITSHTLSGLEITFEASDVTWVCPVLSKDDESYVVVEMADGTAFNLVPFSSMHTRANIEAMAQELMKACPLLLARTSRAVTDNTAEVEK